MNGVTDTVSPFQQYAYVSADTLHLTRYHSEREFASGLEAPRLPYAPRTDNGIALLLLLCFVLTSLTLGRSKKLLSEMLKGFIYHRERTSLFSFSTSGEMRFLLLLLGQTCVLGGVVAFNYFVDAKPALITLVHPHVLLGIYIGVALAFLLFKWLVYSFLGWIFFDKTKSDQWLESYCSLVYYLGFLLFPFVLFLVYFDLSLTYLLVIALVLVIFTKILMFYKWVKLFFDNIFGLFLLIVYFCALEIMPYFIAYRGLMELNELLVIKF